MTPTAGHVLFVMSTTTKGNHSMPARNIDSRTALVSCSRCSRSAYVHREGRNGFVRNDTADGIFRWHSGQERYVSRCRECERAARRAAPNRAQRRAAATSTAMRAVVNGDRKWGVELECIFPSNVSYHDVVRRLRDAGYTNWNVTGDGSLRGNGLEVVSPPLSGDEGFAALRGVCRILRDMGARVDRSCGTHVHHEVRDLSLDALKRFARSWANNQVLIDGLVSESRRGVNRPTYCAAFTAADAAIIEGASALDYGSLGGMTRYKTLNFQSYPRQATVEVRQHQGTLDAAKITAWVRFAQAMIATCAESDTAISPHENVMNFFRSMGERFNETARTFLLGRAVEFGFTRVA